MQGPDQQAYDRGTSIFSPDGRLYQVEYAREAVKRGTPVVGVVVDDGVVLVADGRLRSDLQVPESIEKIHKVDSHIGVASAGHAADARQLIDFARRQAQVERLRYDQPIGLDTLTKTVTDHVQQYTQVGGARPYGAALLFAGVSEGTASLFETDPSGTPYEWKAVAIGSNSKQIQDYLEENYNSEADLDSAFDLAFAALAETDDRGLNPEGMSAATIDVETETYRRLTADELHEAISDAGLLEADEE